MDAALCGRGGREGNVAEPLIANLGDVADPAVKDTGFGINVTVQPNGSFTVVNERNNLTKTYPRAVKLSSVQEAADGRSDQTEITESGRRSNGSGRNPARACAADWADVGASFYEKGSVRIRYQEAGSGFPLLLIAGGGLNSTIAGLNNPFNAIEEFKSEYRCIASDLRNANSGQSSGPLEIDRPWDAYTDDHLGLMDHLGIDKFMVMGFCIGGPFIWNLLRRAAHSDCRRRAGAAQRVASGNARPVLRKQYEGMGSGVRETPARNHDGDGRSVSDQDVPHQPRLRLHRDTRLRAEVPDAESLILPDDIPSAIRTLSPWRPRCSRRSPN